MIVSTQSSSACLAKIFLESANRGLPHAMQCGGSKCEIFQEQEKAKAGTKGTGALRARLGIRYSTKKYEITAREGLQVTVCCMWVRKIDLRASSMCVAYKLSRADLAGI